MSFQKLPIGDYVEPVSKWKPKDSCEDDTIRYIDLSSVDQNKKEITLKGEIFVKDAPSRARQILKPNDVLVSTVRPNLNGVAYVTDELDETIGSTGFCVLRSRTKKLCGRYLFHWVKSPQFIVDMTQKATGQSYPAVSDKLVKESLIPLPKDLDEQKRIAAILDQADSLRRTRRQSIEKLNSLSQAIFYEMFGDPKINPKGFSEVKLQDIIDFVGGSQPPKIVFSDYPSPEKIRLVQMRDFKTDKYITYIPKDKARRFFEKDDVMIGRYGPPVFQILRGLSGAYNVALMKAVPKDKIEKDFVYYLLQEKGLHSYVVANSERTAGQSGVNLELLNEYPAYRPPHSLQIKFCGRITALNAHRERLEESFKNANNLFLSLQQRAFRGEL